MAKHANKGVMLSAWPTADKERFETLTAKRGPFDSGAWSAIAEKTVQGRRYGYGLWLGFLQQNHMEDLALAPEERVTHDRVRGYVTALRRNCTDTTVSIALQRLRHTIEGLAPDFNWLWLYRVERRIAFKAIPLPKSHALSSDLFRIGLDLMDQAEADAGSFGRILLRHAECHRDGLMIALLAEAPMRRATFAQLRLKDHVFKDGTRWQIMVTADMVKTRTEQDFEVSETLGPYLDRYVAEFRPVFENAAGHLGMWPYGNRPMADKMIRRYTLKHTEAKLGEAISPHGFRRAAATTAVIQDPENVRSVKDLLGHKTFAMTENHYVVSRSRSAGRTLQEVLTLRTKPQ